jgi:O-antigen/teichoic acid export membrane protein
MMRTVVKDTAIYGAGAFLTKALGFLLIPLYTRYLDVADYGALALLNLILQIVSFVGLLGVSTAAMRFYLDAQATDETRRQTYGNATGLLILCPVLVVLVLAGPLWWAVDRFVPSLEFLPYVLAILLTGLCTPLEKLLLGLFRVRREPGAFIAFQIAFFLTQAGAIITALVWFDAGLQGQVYAQLLANFVFWCVALVRLSGYARPRVTPPLAGQLLRFGVPLMPFFILTWMNEAAGRFLLERFNSIADVGVFTLASQFSGILGLVALSVENALMPHFLERASAVGSESALGRLAGQHFALLGLVALAVVLVATPAILIMATPDYHDATRWVAPLTLAAWLYLSSNPAIWTLTWAKRTGSLSTLRALSTAVLVGSLLLFLGPLAMGIAGVVVATLLTAAFSIASAFVLARQSFRLRVPWGRVLATAAVVVGAGAVLHGLDADLRASGRIDPLRLLLKAALAGGAAAAVLSVSGIGNPLRWLRAPKAA